jgi:peptide/nickel transport system substrate-binding protein
MSGDVMGELRRRDILKLGAAAGSLALAGPLLAACGNAAAPAPTGGATKKGGTMTGAFDQGPGGQPEVFNPLTVTAGATWLQTYYSPLLRYDLQFRKLVPALAQSWRVSSDATQYTFKLRKDVRWHDGQPFTSADVRFTLELATDPASASTIGKNLPPIASIDAPDEQTVTMKLAAADVTVLNTLTTLVMVPKHALFSFTPSELVKSDWWRTKPIGTGPFQWSSYTPGQFTELTAFDKYMDGRPRLNKLINRYFAEPGSAVIALRKGDVQYDYLSLADAQAIKDDGKFRVISASSMVVNYLGFNLKQERFKDLKVRQAFLHAIDRKTIVQRLYKGGATLVDGAYDNPRYRSQDATSYGYDVGKAKQLLEDAKWDSIKGGPIEILSYYTDQLSTSVLTTFQQLLSKIGVQVTIRQVDAPTFGDLTRVGKFDVFFGGRTNGPDPDAIRTAFLSTATPPSGQNYIGLNLPKLDQLFSTGRQEVDAGKRAAIYQQLDKLFSEQLPVAPMWVATRYGGVASSVRNFVWAPVSNNFYAAAWQDWGLAANS